MQEHLPADFKENKVAQMFFILFFTNFFVNIDNGILPACTQIISEELNLTTEQFGTLGSIVYIGQTVGCLTCSFFLQRMNEKIVFPTVLSLNVLTLIWFTTHKSFSSLLVCRMLLGLFQEAINVYYPVWVDVYASEEKKSSWMSIIMIGATSGNIFGYILAACLQANHGWRAPFYFQSFLLMLAVFGFLVTPDKYVQLKAQTPIILAHQGKSLDKNDIPFFQGVRQVVSRCAFLRMACAATMLMFVVTCIQFWFSDFLITVMGVKNETVYATFGFVSVTGPVLGVIFGGFVSSKLGGYNNSKSLYVTSLVATFACLCSTPVAFLSPPYFPLQVCFLWSLLFAGGFTMPSITGMMLNSVPPHLKTTANSVSNAMYNIFGLLPSPYIYGAIADMGQTVGGNKRTAMFVNLSLSWMAAIPVCYQACLVYKKENKKTIEVDKETFVKVVIK